MGVLQRDIRILEKEIEKWEETERICKNQLNHLDDILKKAEAALEFIRKSDDKLKKQPRTREEWQKHPELSYVNSMDGLF